MPEHKKAAPKGSLARERGVHFTTPRFHSQITAEKRGRKMIDKSGMQERFLIDVSYSVREHIKNEMHKYLDISYPVEYFRIPDGDKKKVDKGLLKSFSLYVRSLEAHNNKRIRKPHPLFYNYVECLSDEGALGEILATARKYGVAPKYSAKTAQKYGIKKGNSYAYSFG